MTEAGEKTSDIPGSWSWTNLGEISIIESGGTPSTKYPDNFGGEIPWVTPADLSGFNDKFISKG